MHQRSETLFDADDADDADTGEKNREWVVWYARRAGLNPWYGIEY